MKKYSLVAILLAGAVSAPAMAQDSNDGFTGLRVEAIGGYDQLKTGSSTASDIEGRDETVDGALYGAAVGYDVDLGGFVVGAEAELSGTTAKQDADERLNTPFGYRVNVDRDVYVGGRVGFVVAPTTMVYAKGGYTSTRVESVFTDNAQDDGVDFDFETGQSIDGYRVGAGVEQKIGSNAYAKIEYRYSNYDHLKFDDDVFGDEALGIDLDRHQVVAGVGLRF